MMYLILKKRNKFIVKTQNVNVSISFIFRPMVLTISNVYVNIHILTMIQSPENVIKELALGAMPGLIVPGHAVVDINLEIIKPS